MSDLLELQVVYYQQKDEKSDFWSECELIPYSLHYTLGDARDARNGLSEDLDDPKMERYTVKKISYDELRKEVGLETLTEWADSGLDSWIVDGDNEFDPMDLMDEELDVDEQERLEIEFNV